MGRTRYWNRAKSKCCIQKHSDLRSVVQTGFIQISSLIPSAKPKSSWAFMYWKARYTVCVFGPFLAVLKERWVKTARKKWEEQSWWGGTLILSDIIVATWLSAIFSIKHSCDIGMYGKIGPIFVTFNYVYAKFSDFGSSALRVDFLLSLSSYCCFSILVLHLTLVFQ